MVTNPSVDADDGLPLAALKRADALATLRDGSMTRRELMDTLDVSRTTIHRLVRALEAADLVDQQGNDFVLTVFGHTVAEEVSTYRRRISAASRMQPFLETVDAFPGEIELFAEATVTVTEPTNPYAPVERFINLVTASGTLRGFDTTAIAPIIVPDIREAILSGMETDMIYLPPVVESIVEEYPDDIAEVADSGRLTLSTHSNLPFGLAIFDDRIGLGGYDAETGMLRTFVDTDDDRARTWALDLYDEYREEATAKDLSQLVNA